jgi:hypothetical protein
MQSRKIAVKKTGDAKAGNAKTGKIALKKKPGRKQSRVDAEVAAKRLAEKVFEARLKFHRWKELASALYENQDRRLVTPDGEEDDDCDVVLTPEERAYLTEDDLIDAEVELLEVREILDHMFEQVAAL